METTNFWKADFLGRLWYEKDVMTDRGRLKEGLGYWVAATALWFQHEKKMISGYKAR